MSLTGKGLFKHFGGVKAVTNVDITVDKGQIVGLVGPNGAGKTTLFNLLSGFVRPDAGQIELDGRDSTTDAPNVRCQHGLSRTFQQVKIFPGMTCVDNVKVGSHSRTRANVFDAIVRSPRYWREEREGSDNAKAMLALVGMADYGDVPADSLSFGHRRRLELARALISRPNYLLMDEPASGANKNEKAELASLIKKIRDDTGVGIVVVEHSIPFVMGLSDRVVVLAQGETIFVGPPAECMASPAVRQAYLGNQA